MVWNFRNTDLHCFVPRWCTFHIFHHSESFSVMHNNAVAVEKNTFRLKVLLFRLFFLSLWHYLVKHGKYWARVFQWWKQVPFISRKTCQSKASQHHLMIWSTVVSKVVFGATLLKNVVQDHIQPRKTWHMDNESFKGWTETRKYSWHVVPQPVRFLFVRLSKKW